MSTGNRVTASGSTYATGTGNRLADDGTFHYLYDQEGNRTARFVDVNANGLLDAGDTDVTEYQWDYRNRLVKVTDRASYGAAADQIVEYTYDYLNRRFEKTVDTDGDGTPEEYLYNIHRGDELALELTDADGLDGSGYSPELSQRYLYGSAVDEILAVEDAAGDVLWGLADHEGTIRDIVDSTGTVQEHRQYDTFGGLTSAVTLLADFPFAFTGRPLDEETGLYDYRARWYDPAVGRFVSEDPSGFDGGDANLYRYAGNSPVIYVDPSGLCYEGVSGPVGDAVRSFFDNELVTAAMEIGISLMPGFGEFMDLGIAFDSHYSPLERAIAGISFGIGVATLGMSPNVAPFLRATKGLGKMLNRADDVVDVARGLARTATHVDDVVDAGRGLARTARRGADDVATGLARPTRTPRGTTADKVRRFLADESGTMRVSRGQAPNATRALTQTEQGAIRKIDNTIRDHLKEHDYTGTLRDMVGHPVPKRAGGYFDHVREMNDTLRGLRKNAEALKNATDAAAQAARQRALDAIKRIEDFTRGAGL